MEHTLKFARIFVFICTTAAGLLWSQPSAVLQGRIQDQTGGAIAGAVVELKPRTGGDARSVVTGPDGAYVISGIPAGLYEMRVSYSGFNPAVREVNIQAAGSTLDIRLSAATIAERIDVSASAAQLQTVNATQTVQLQSTQIQRLPTASRNFTHLIVAEAGVSANLPDRTGRGLNLATSPGGQAEDGTQSVNPSVNGARPTNNSLSLNGLDTTNMMNGNGSLGNNINVPLDALEVVEVQTALYSATTGRNGGGNIQLITKSGTNDFHGSIYHFIQNERLNANEFFLNRAGQARPKFRRNETGATFGGRIIRDRIFFFGSVQRTDFLTGFASRAIASTGVPEGLGDVRTRESIAQVANAWLQSGAKVPGFAQNFLNAIRAFPADQVPGLERKFFDDVATLRFRTLTAADIHPVAINILNAKRNGQFLLPSAREDMPILPATASFGQERLLQQSFPTFFNSWSGSGGLDIHAASSTRLRLNYSRSSQYVEEAFGWANSSPSPTLGQSPSYAASMNLTHTFSPRWVNELRGGFFELYNTRISKYRDFMNSTLGIYNPLESALGGLAALMPTIDINTQRSTSGIGNAWDFFDRQRVIHVTNITSFTSGKHTFQFGGEFRRPTIAGEYMARTNGDLDYSNWVFFFTGHGASGGGSDLDQGDTRRHFKFKDFGLFAQHDWRVRPGLTLNLGVRWDYYAWPIETEGRIGTYLTPEAAARMNMPVGFIVAPSSVFFDPDFHPLKVGIYVEPNTPWNLDMIHKARRESVIEPDWNNVAPRFGFAWQPKSLPKVVFRGGYGIFFERPSGSFKTDLQLSMPFFIYQNVPAPLDMANPYPRLNVNPFQIPFNVQIARNENGTPSWRKFDGSPFPSTEPFNAKNTTFVDPFIRIPYTQQWTFNIQFEPAAGSLIDLRYVGSRGVGLQAKLNLAQPLDPRETPVNGFTDIRDARGSLINPDFFVKPEFLGIGRNGLRWRSNWGHSTYNALQVNFRQRPRWGFAWNLAYTWQKSIDNISSDEGIIEHDAFNSRLNRGLSDFDRTHRFTASYIYQFPTPWRDRRAARLILGGWSVAGLATLQSGAPFTPLGNSSRNAYFAQVSRVRLDFARGMTLEDAVRSGRVQDRLDNYYNVNAFTDSLDHWGNAGRNILRGPSQAQFDFSFAKLTSIKERYQAEFRWELFNATNTPVFNNPASTFAANGPGTAGVISSTIGGPRTMQAGLRLRW